MHIKSAINLYFNIIKNEQLKNEIIQLINILNNNMSQNVAFNEMLSNLISFRNNKELLSIFIINNSKDTYDKYINLLNKIEIFYNLFVISKENGLFNDIEQLLKWYNDNSSNNKNLENELVKLGDIGIAPTQKINIDKIIINENKQNIFNNNNDKIFIILDRLINFKFLHERDDNYISDLIKKVLKDKFNIKNNTFPANDYKLLIASLLSYLKNYVIIDKDIDNFNNGKAEYYDKKLKSAAYICNEILENYDLAIKKYYEIIYDYMGNYIDNLNISDINEIKSNIKISLSEYQANISKVFSYMYYYNNDLGNINEYTILNNIFSNKIISMKNDNLEFKNEYYDIYYNIINELKIRNKYDMKKDLISFNLNSAVPNLIEDIINTSSNITTGINNNYYDFELTNFNNSKDDIYVYQEENISNPIGISTSIDPNYKKITIEDYRTGKNTTYITPNTWNTIDFNSKLLIGNKSKNTVIKLILTEDLLNIFIDLNKAFVTNINENYDRKVRLTSKLNDRYAKEIENKNNKIIEYMHEYELILFIYNIKFISDKVDKIRNDYFNYIKDIEKDPIKKDKAETLLSVNNIKMNILNPHAPPEVIINNLENFGLFKSSSDKEIIDMIYNFENEKLNSRLNKYKFDFNVQKSFFNLELDKFIEYIKKYNEFMPKLNAIIATLGLAESKYTTNISNKIERNKNYERIFYTDIDNTYYNLIKYEIDVYPEITTIRQIDNTKFYNEEELKELIKEYKRYQNIIWNNHNNFIPVDKNIKGIFFNLENSIKKNDPKEDIEKKFALYIKTYPHIVSHNRKIVSVIEKYKENSNKIKEISNQLNKFKNDFSKLAIDPSSDPKFNMDDPIQKSKYYTSSILRKNLIKQFIEQNILSELNTFNKKFDENLNRQDRQDREKLRNRLTEEELLNYEKLSNKFNAYTKQLNNDIKENKRILNDINIGPKINFDDLISITKDTNIKTLENNIVVNWRELKEDDREKILDLNIRVLKDDKNEDKIKNKLNNDNNIDIYDIPNTFIRFVDLEKKFSQ